MRGVAGIRWLKGSWPLLLLACGACHSGPSAEVHCTDLGKNLTCDVDAHRVPDNVANICFDLTVTCDDNRRPGTHLCYSLGGRAHGVFPVSAVARAITCQGNRTGISVTDVTVVPRGGPPVPSGK